MDAVIVPNHFVLNEPPVYGLEAWNGSQYLKVKDVLGIVRPNEPLEISVIYGVLTAFQALATPTKEEREKEYYQLDANIKAVTADNSIATLSLDKFERLAPESQDLEALYIDA